MGGCLFRTSTVVFAQLVIYRKDTAMGVVPNSIVGRIQFFEEHLPVWVDNAAKIGLSSVQLTDLATRTAQARADFETALASRSEAKANTELQNLSVGSMYNLGSDLIKTVRAYAETTEDPTVYASAQIPAPATPTPLGPPATPTDLAVTLTTVGDLELTWKASRAGGTSFSIERQTGPTGSWSLIGTSEDKTFTDSAVPTGETQIAYRVTAARSGGASDPTPPFVVYFGTAGASSGGESLTLAA